MILLITLLQVESCRKIYLRRSSQELAIKYMLIYEMQKQIYSKYQIASHVVFTSM